MTDLFFTLLGGVLMLLGVGVGVFISEVARNGWPKPVVRKVSRVGPGQARVSSMRLYPDEPEPTLRPPAAQVVPGGFTTEAEDMAASNEFYALQDVLRAQARFGDNAGMLNA